MGWAGGLLSVMGGAGEGGFKAMGKNAEDAIAERKQQALEKRLTNLEKVKHRYSQEDIRLQDTLATTRGKTAYEQRVADEEATHLRRTGEEETKYQRKQAEKKTEAGPVGKTFQDLEKIFGTEKAKEILLESKAIKGDKEKKDTGKLVSDAYIKGAQALMEGKASLSAVNASLQAINAPMRFKENQSGEFDLVSTGGSSNKMDLFSDLLGRAQAQGGNRSSVAKKSSKSQNGLLGGDRSGFPPTGFRDNATMVNPPW